MAPAMLQLILILFVIIFQFATGYLLWLVWRQLKAQRPPMPPLKVFEASEPLKQAPSNPRRSVTYLTSTHEDRILHESSKQVEDDW
jgi:hypothetical protein